MLEKIVRIFGCLPVENTEKAEINQEPQLEALQYGVYFSPIVVANYDKSKLQELLRNMSLNPQQYNNTFHKSFKTVMKWWCGNCGREEDAGFERGVTTEELNMRLWKKANQEE